MPYRDFYFFLPPVYLYIIVAFTYIFGGSLFLLSILGIVVLLALTSVLFLLLSRIFPVYIACVATIVSMFYYQSDVAFASYNFPCFVHLFALLSALLICKYYDMIEPFQKWRGWRAVAYLFLAGLFGVFAFLTNKAMDYIY